jgi:hypothetical protein
VKNREQPSVMIIIIIKHSSSLFLRLQRTDMFAPPPAVPESPPAALRPPHQAAVHEPCSGIAGFPSAALLRHSWFLIGRRAQATPHCLARAADGSPCYSTAGHRRPPYMHRRCPLCVSHTGTTRTASTQLATPVDFGQ